MYDKCSTALDAAWNEWGAWIGGEYNSFGRVSGSGTTRAVFRIGGGMVLKVPRYNSAIKCNEREARIAKEGGMFNYTDRTFPPELCAPCELIDYMGVPCLLMEEVEPIPEIEAPDIFDGFCDGPQVGRMKDGKIVCYDFAAEDTLD